MTYENCDIQQSVHISKTVLLDNYQLKNLIKSTNFMKYSIVDHVLYFQKDINVFKVDMFIPKWCIIDDLCNVLYIDDWLHCDFNVAMIQLYEKSVQLNGKGCAIEKDILTIKQIEYLV